MRNHQTTSEKLSEVVRLGLAVRLGWDPIARPEALGAEVGSRKIAAAIYG